MTVPALCLNKRNCFVYTTRAGFPGPDQKTLTFCVLAVYLLPSLIGAGLANNYQSVYDIYDSLPWERTADFLGGVNGDYTWGADTFGSLFWFWTLTIGLGAG